MANTFDNVPEWTPGGGDRDDDRPSIPAPPEGQKMLEQEHPLLFVGGPLSGRKMFKRGERRRWEIVWCPDLKELCAYEQDRPGSNHYFINRAKTAWLQEHRETIVRKLGPTMNTVKFGEDQ